MKLLTKYVYSKPFGMVTHSYYAIGGAGGVVLWFRNHGKIDEQQHWGAGLEVHSRSPWPHSPHDGPLHLHCEVTGGACWHDGTSLYPTESLLPIFLADPTDHDRMMRRAEMEYVSRFVKDCENSAE